MTKNENIFRKYVTVSKIEKNQFVSRKSVVLLNQCNQYFAEQNQLKMRDSDILMHNLKLKWRMDSNIYIYYYYIYWC